MPVFKKIPMTRNISVVIHEPVFPCLKDWADKNHGGNVSDGIRLLVYAALIRSGDLPIEKVKELG